jgi:coenzyme F420 hydrogenase subunit beta
MSFNFKNAKDIVDNGLCLGCGVCLTVCPCNSISLKDITDIGIRPIIDFDTCNNCGLCVKVCPGTGISHLDLESRFSSDAVKAWGPVLEVWQGYAKDEKIRFAGSSGGVVTALSMYALEKDNYAGVLHTKASSDSPLSNTAVISRNRKDLLSAMGSRYSPATPCESIGLLEQADGDCLFIGKSCDIQAVEKLKSVNNKFAEKIGLTIGIFCAGTPTTAGTLKLLDKMQVSSESLQNIMYRGNGWPGKTTAQISGSEERTSEIEYDKAWGEILANNIQARCFLCPDTTAEFADISCGDAWHIKGRDSNPGCSVIVIRTEKGREFFDQAVKEDYLEIEKVSDSVLKESQKPLLLKRQTIWGRLLALKLKGRACPCYNGFHLFDNWVRLPFGRKVRSFLSMMRD